MKRIKVKVIPNAKKNEVLEEDGKFKVYVKAPPIDGKANKALIELLARHFKVKKDVVRVIRGKKSKEKIVGIDTRC